MLLADMVWGRLLRVGCSESTGLITGVGTGMVSTPGVCDDDLADTVLPANAAVTPSNERWAGISVSPVCLIYQAG
jgi:hypothetical protein